MGGARRGRRRRRQRRARRRHRRPTQRREVGSGGGPRARSVWSVWPSSTGAERLRRGQSARLSGIATPTPRRRRHEMTTRRVRFLRGFAVRRGEGSRWSVQGAASLAGCHLARSSRRRRHGLGRLGGARAERERGGWRPTCKTKEVAAARGGAPTVKLSWQHLTAAHALDVSSRAAPRHRVWRPTHQTKPPAPTLGSLPLLRGPRCLNPTQPTCHGTRAAWRMASS